MTTNAQAALMAAASSLSHVSDSPGRVTGQAEVFLDWLGVQDVLARQARAHEVVERSAMTAPPSTAEYEPTERAKKNRDGRR